MDIVSLLQQCFAKGSLPSETGQLVTFPDGQEFNKSDSTGLAVHNGGTYTLGDVLYFYKNKDLPISEYLKGTRTHKLTNVRYVDRKNLLALFQQAPNTDAFPSLAATKGLSVEQGSTDAADLKVGQENKNPKQRTLEREVALADRNSVLLSGQQFRDVIELEKLAKVAPKKRKTDDGKLKSSSAGLPIIIVPASASSPLTIYNIKKFLEDGSYVPHADAKKLSEQRFNEVVVSRKQAKNGVLKFKVVDSTKRFSPHHWNRVVAVFAQGQEWQFKGWKWSAPAEVFKNSRGFYVCFDDIKVPPIIKSWNVNVYSIKKQQRHLDGLTRFRIWENIDSFLASQKSYLL